MSPVDSDVFTASDYATTFTKLDNQPGVKIVANYTALTAYSAGFSVPTNHNGEVAVQVDNGAMWYWKCPSGSGSWIRANSIPGHLLQTTQPSDVSTATKTGNGSAIWPSPTTITCPGGRPIRIDVNVNCDNDKTGGDGVVVLNLMVDTTAVRTMYVRPGNSFKDQTDSSGPSFGTDQFISYFMSTNPGDTHQFNLRIRSGAGPNVSGTATARNAVLTVREA